MSLSIPTRSTPPSSLSSSLSSTSLPPSSSPSLASASGPSSSSLFSFEISAGAGGLATIERDGFVCFFLPWLLISEEDWDFGGTTAFALAILMKFWLGP